jgi:hypothetical protein
MMFKIKTLLAFIIPIVGIFPFIATVSAFDHEFTCSLECNKIGPKPADTKAKGNVIFQLDENKQEIFYRLSVENIKDTYMAHLHLGPSNSQGPIAVWLYPLYDHDSSKRLIEGEFSGTLAQGIINQNELQDGIKFEELAESMKNGQAYVNVHTQKFLPGEIRGQVMRSAEQVTPKISGSQIF